MSHKKCLILEMALPLNNEECIRWRMRRIAVLPLYPSALFTPVVRSTNSKHGRGFVCFQKSFRSNVNLTLCNKRSKSGLIHAGRPPSLITGIVASREHTRKVRSARLKFLTQRPYTYNMCTLAFPYTGSKGIRVFRARFAPVPNSR